MSCGVSSTSSRPPTSASTTGAAALEGTSARRSALRWLKVHQVERDAQRGRHLVPDRLTPQGRVGDVAQRAVRSSEQPAQGVDDLPERSAVGPVDADEPGHPSPARGRGAHPGRCALPEARGVLHHGEEHRAVEGRALPAYGVGPAGQRPVDPHPARSVLAVPGTRAEPVPVLVAVVVLAREHERHEDVVVADVAPDDDHGAVLALGGVLLVGDPHPDHLAGVRVAVGHGGVLGADLPAEVPGPAALGSLIGHRRSLGREAVGDTSSCRVGDPGATRHHRNCCGPLDV